VLAGPVSPGTWRLTAALAAGLLACAGALSADFALGARGRSARTCPGAAGVKDVIQPGEFRKARAQVLVARAEGQAALKRARGATAALRSKASAARMAADNPL
jgi:hypothetical protein